MSSHGSGEHAHADAASDPGTAVELREQKRWLTYFGSPALVAAIFVGVSFGTGQEWYLGLAVAAIITQFYIGIMVWLALSSDTNAKPSAARRALASLPVAGGAHAVELREQKRWLTYFGSPALVAAIFVGVSFGTGQEWYLGLAVAAIITDIGIAGLARAQLGHQRASGLGGRTAPLNATERRRGAAISRWRRRPRGRGRSERGRPGRAGDARPRDPSRARRTLAVSSVETKRSPA